MSHFARNSFVIVSAILLLWIVFAESCMKMRISDSLAKKEFSDSGVVLTTKTMLINGFPFHYAETGSDTLPTLLFVHGTPGSWDAFQHYLRNKELLKRYRVISIDRPGFGYSNFGVPLHLGKQTEIICDWMDSIRNGKPFIIIGHSLGGPLVVKLAAARPQYTKDIIILAGALDPHAEKPEKWRPVLFKTPLNLLVPGAMRPSNEELWYLKTDLYEMQPDFAKITCPVYVMHGVKDMLVPYSNTVYAKKMFTHAANFELITFPEENHFIPWTKEREITKLLMEL
jgi:pimeloyl-ACP methyl ester carboxylesterase